jgi:hypothetical protein
MRIVSQKFGIITTILAGLGGIELILLVPALHVEWTFPMIVLFFSFLL